MRAITLLGAVALAACGSDDAPTQAAGDTTAAASTGDVEPHGTTEDLTSSSTDAAESSSGDAVPPDAPTWHQDIAPLVSKSCSGCHAAQGIAPYVFSDYEDAAALAPVLAAAVASGSMPPWGAAITEECTPPMGFKDDISLDPEQIELFAAWADAGAPQGDPSLASELPPPPDTELMPVDTVLEMGASVTIDGSADQFLCFSLDAALEEERYFSGMQIVPGNDKIVHHALVYLDESGDSGNIAGPDGAFDCNAGGLQGTLIGAWAPGSVPMRTPDDVGTRVTPGSRIVLNVHYHPTGLGPEVDDATSIQLDWLDERPTWRSEMALVGNSDDPDVLLPNAGDRGSTPQFRIPAGAQGHVEEMVFEIPDDLPQVRVWSVGAHMHYVGTGMQIRFQGDNYDSCMLETPHYSFEWQRLYNYDAALDEMPLAIAGDRIYLRCEYDNSMNNPYVVDALQEQGLDAPVDVVLGEETLDEMCLGVFAIAVPSIF